MKYEFNTEEFFGTARRILNESRNFHVRFWLNIVFFCISAYQVDDLSQVGLLVCCFIFVYNI